MYTPPPPPDPYPPSPGDPGRAQYRPVVSPQPSPRTRLSTIRIAKPTPPQWLVLGGGALTVLGAFLPWSAISLGLAPHAPSLDIIGWQSAFGKATGILGLAALTLALLRVGGATLPRVLTRRTRAVAVLLGSEALLLSVLYLLDGVRVVALASAASVGAGIGLYAAIVGAAAIVAGGLLGEQNSSWLL